MRSRLTLCYVTWLMLAAGCTTMKSNQTIFGNQGNQIGRPSLQKKSPEELTRIQQTQLAAAIKLVNQNKPDAAKQIADQIEQFRLSNKELSKLNLVYAQIGLSQGEAESALNRLRLVQYALLNPSEQIIYLRTKAFAWSLTGKLIESAKARIALQPLLKDPRQQQDNKVGTLETLRLLPMNALQIHQPPTANTLSGWMALAMLLNSTPNLTIDDPNLALWRSNFSKHPANGAFLTAYVASFQGIPTSIALLLPGSGPYAQAAKAIKDGIMAAYESDTQTTSKPEIKLYDSMKNDPVTLYKEAVAKGAQLVIGPLNKEHVQALGQTASLDIPVLTLNHIPGLNKFNLYQFALSPIDDAEQVTREAEQNGHKKVIVLTPSTELGERIQGYFKTALKNTDGTVVKAKSYNPDAHDYVTLLRDLLGLNESEKRFGELNRIIPELYFTPRRRQDVEAILMTAYPQNAHDIQANLQKLGTTIPLYATSHIYNGVVNPDDSDLNGITFCDIPWLFNAAYPGNLSQESLRELWQKYPEIYLRLIAMGIDAYNLIPHLSKLGMQSYQGATGNLRITDENRLQRQLVCGKFNHNQPQLLTHQNADNKAATTAAAAQ